MSRWHHGHSLATGVLIGLLLERHMLLFLVLAFAAGLGFERGLRGLRGLARHVKARGAVAR